MNSAILWILPTLFTLSKQQITFSNGVNLQPSYYGDPSFAWDLMKQQDYIKTVRIEISSANVNVSLAKKWIDEAKNNGYHVIATYHNVSGMFKNLY